MRFPTVRVEMDFPLTVKQAAQFFADLDDEAQTQFFVEVAKAAQDWPNNPDMQWCRIGQHLAECECSTEGARDMVRSLATHMESYIKERG